MNLFKSNIKKSAAVLAVSSLFVLGAAAQNITTANEFFKTVSDFYGTLQDYQAKTHITVGKQEMNAAVTYLQPDKVRLDFSEPAEQTIVFNGETLTVYLPEYEAVLTQNANSGAAAGGNLASAEGLSLMRRYYTVSYETGPEPVPIDEDSDEKVIKLVLWRRTTSEAFRYIKLSIEPDTKLIRRLEAVTPSNVEYIFNFSEYELNQGLTVQRFSYDIPSAANSYDNFLFSE